MAVVGAWFAMRLQRAGRPFTALPTCKLPRGSQAQAACTFTLSSSSSHWMRQLRQPSSPQLPQFLQRGMIDDDNNAACLAPWWRALCELMEACRLCTWGRLRGCPGTPTKLGCPSLWGWCEGRLEDIGLEERETRLWGIPTMKWDLPCPLALFVEGHPCPLLLEQHEVSAWGRIGAGPLLGFAACKTARQGSCSVCCVKRTRRVTKAYRTELPCSGNILATSLGGPSVRVQEAEGARAMYPHRTMSLMMGWGTDSPAVQLRVASHLGEAEGHFLSVTPDEQPHCCLRPVDNWKIATVPSPEA